MLQEFLRRMCNASGKEFSWRKRKINCLAHVINLATQCLISTYSKTPHFDPKNPEAHVPTARDEVGLVRAVAVKHINTFIDELRWEESDSSRRDKIRALRLDQEEWKRVELFTDLLLHADRAQQAFSSDKVSTLHLAIPALEALHRAWSSCAICVKYTGFSSALQSACQKIDDYYEKMTDSPAYIMAMILDPSEKMSYFNKHWPKNLQAEVSRCVEEVVHHSFHHYYVQHIDLIPRTPKSSTKGLNVLLRELSDDESKDNGSEDGSSSMDDPNRPWLQYFSEYIDLQDKIPKGLSMIEWWGFNSHQFHPAWGSLARDYLLMASSVSSERAFLQGGLTITKQRNRLKGDIVEALQCLKCAVRHDLLFREPGPSSLLERELENVELDANGGEPEMVEGWDELLSEDDDNENVGMDIHLDSD
ncbi:hypothetical protein C0992_007879 [Termitomyces sp. T32_za158]|nr:hypothetical protein C0992_007879 [Termitomyces sp. T32_za158]